ncbi:hypothetical protein SERLA73DRAFT_79725 [Serpula lacrymans var. lacrymans S7.3]|uniref:Uncharacterized protein n=1 Tax=Serpula lacrymans var. lacrymans (strain S7.3) TaxID=936435 RepID=F8QHD1_SERL3|nr:hypothetical protein SERLA73DRAFT_79725 [Serpula lacrymans var. lacrymans S7.3]
MSFPVRKACVIFVVGLTIGSPCTYFYIKRVFNCRIRLSLPVVDLTTSRSSGFVQTGSDARSVVGTFNDVSGHQININVYPTPNIPTPRVDVRVSDQEVEVAIQ